MKYIFLSYSHIDIDRIMPVIRRISASHNILYDTNIGIAREYNNEIADMIDNVSIIFAFISDNYVRSSYCIDEILFARNHEIPILLIYLDNTVLPSGLQLRLGRFQAFNWDSDRFEEGIAKIESNEVVMECSKEKASAVPLMKSADKTVYEELYHRSEPFYLDELRQENSEGEFKAAVGIIQDKGGYALYSLDFVHSGNYMITGAAGTGKSTLVQDVLYSLIHAYSPEELNIFIVDRNNYMYECFTRAPHCGAVINRDDTDQIRYLMHHLQKVYDERIHLVKGGTITSYNRTHSGKLPYILTVMDNVDSVLEVLSESHGDIFNVLLRDGIRYGLYFCTVNNRAVPLISYSSKVDPGKLRAAFRDCVNGCIAMGAMTEEEYIDRSYSSGRESFEKENFHPIYGYASNRGYGYVHDGEMTGVCRFAVPLEADNIYIREQIIEKECMDLGSRYSVFAPGITTVPNVLGINGFLASEAVKDLPDWEKRLPFGQYYEDGGIASIDLDSSFLTAVIGKYDTNIRSLFNVLLKASSVRHPAAFYLGKTETESLIQKDDTVRFGGDPEEYELLLRELLLDHLKQRNERKRELLQENKSEPEIREIMRQEFPLLILFIEDFSAVFPADKNKMTDSSLRNAIDVLMKKGAVRNFYIFAGIANSANYSDIKYDPLFKYLTDNANYILVNCSIEDQSYKYGSMDAVRDVRNKPIKSDEGLMLRNEKWAHFKIPT